MPSRFLTFGWLLLALVVGPSSCRRGDSPTTKFGGSWTLQLGARAFAVLDLTQTVDRVAGTMSMPERFEVGPSGLHFSNISNRVTQRRISNVVVNGNHLHFSTTNPKDPHDTDALDLTLTGPEEATLKFADASFNPWTVKRLPRGIVAVVSTDWEATRSYSPDDSLPSNGDMQKIFEADQQPRQKWASLSDASVPR
jgi:hypothetical protein